MVEEKNQGTLSLYCEVSSCIGVIDWYKAKYVGKIFWAVMLTACLVVTLWQTHGVIVQFINRAPYKTSISKNVTNEGIQYPNITICNFNRAKQSLINQTNLDPKVLSYVFQLTGVTYTSPLELLPGLNLTEYEETWKNHFRIFNYTSPKDFYRRYGHGYNETVALITFNGLPMPLGYEEVWTLYGRCFNILPITLRQSVAGANMALKLFLNPHIKEYMTDTIVNNYLQDGLIIEPNYDFQPVMPTPIVIAPGAFASISLTASKQVTVIENTPLLSGDCQANTTLTILNDPYTSANCMYDCYLRGMFHKCGCTTLANTKPGYPVCNLTTIITCASSWSMMRVTPEFFVNLLNGNNITGKNQYDSAVSFFEQNRMACSEQCRVPCYDFMTVDASVTTTNSVSRGLRHPLLKYVKSVALVDTTNFDDDFAENFIAVEVYFSSMAINVVTTEENIPIFTFIGNVGGQLGLWFGVTILTLVQCVYYFFIACVNGELYSWCEKYVGLAMSKIKSFRCTSRRERLNAFPAGCKIRMNECGDFS